MRLAVRGIFFFLWVEFCAVLLIGCATQGFLSKIQFAKANAQIAALKSKIIQYALCGSIGGMCMLVPLLSAIVSGICAIIVAAIGAASARERKRTDARAAVRAEESLLSMRMMSASIDLGVATAMAVQDQKFNGEMTVAKQNAAEIQKDYQAFLQRTTAHQVSKS